MSRRLLVIAGFALLLGACLGPKPSVGRVDLRAPDKEGASYLLIAEVRNNAGGKGEISVQGKLTDVRSGKTYRAEETVHLGSHETTLVTLRIEAPPGDYAPEVTAEYPPR